MPGGKVGLTGLAGYVPRYRLSGKLLGQIWGSGALGFLRLEPRTREVRTLHSWLSTSNGSGLIAAGMARPGYDISVGR